MNITKKSLDLTEYISIKINNLTFHHLYHILFDIGVSYPTNDLITYVEIGCYGGGSACLMLQRPNTNVISIDLGVPIDESIVHTNVNKLNVLGNKYNYIKGNSHAQETYNKLTNLVSEIDILFIDGGHSKMDVITDFNMYEKLVKKGGYIIFDDYNDYIHSPEVKIGVDSIISGLTGYNIIGVIENTFNARPAELKEGNCFVIQKL